MQSSSLPVQNVRHMALRVAGQVREQCVYKISDLVAYEQGSKFRPCLSVRRSAAEATAIQVARALRCMVKTHLLTYMVFPFPMAGPAKGRTIHQHHS